MNIEKAQYVFPRTERMLFTKTGRVLAVFELLIHVILISSTIESGNLNGLWASLAFCCVFGWVHFENLRARKYCLAKWDFDGWAFCVFIKNERRVVELDQPFCISKTKLSFNRRYTSEKYPYYMIWKPGGRAPYEEMNGYAALMKRDAILIPCNEQTGKLFRDELNIRNIPDWPRSGVYAGIKT